MITVPYDTDDQSVPAALAAVGAGSVLAGCDKILLKPNLVTDSPFPVTTRPEFCAAVIAWLRSHTDADITIAEGCGSCTLETTDIFSRLGYDDLAVKMNVSLMDLNSQPLITKRKPHCPVFPKMHLPEVAFTHTIISLPVLKAHSLAGITGSMKNMMGFPPPSHYSGAGGSWKKAIFHQRMQQSIVDLCQYIRPTLTLMDASVGLSDYHLGGETLSPPAGMLIAGTDAKACDREAARILGKDWRTIGHLA